MGRRGRFCLYPNCDHCQGNNVKKCKFRTFPKDPLKARRWLDLAGIGNHTPKKLLPHWTLCSCHFLEDALEPEEFIEEYGDDASFGMTKQRDVSPFRSPAAKKLRMSSLTPSSREAAEGLLRLCETRKKTPTYSPKRSLWKLHESVSQSDYRSRLHHRTSFTEIPEDLGITPLPEEDIPSESSPFQAKKNDNAFAARSLNFNDIVESTFHLDTWEVSQESGYIYDHGPLQGSQLVSSTPLLNNHESRNPITSSDVGTCEMCGADLNKGNSLRSIGIQCTRSYLCYDKCKLLPEVEFTFYTGISQETFELLYEFLGGDNVCSKLKYEFRNKTPKRDQFQGDLTPKDKMLLTLIRLRRGIPLRDLKVVFNISESHASRICYTWIRFMSLEFRKLEKVMFLSTESQNGRRPKCFKEFKNLRVIIDATEFRIQKPHNQQQQSNSFSDYKSYHTIKFLFGISCFGGLSFMSEGFEGSMSDRKLVEESGFMDYLESQDGVMSDKGFDMEDKCDEKEVDLYIPSFLGRRSAFTGRELIYSRAIAVSRIFVEIFIGKVKQFRLVRYCIPNSMLPVASDLVRVCAFLVNFQKPFVKMNEDTSS